MHINYLYPQVALEKIDAMLLSVTNSTQTFAIKSMCDQQLKKGSIKDEALLYSNMQTHYLNNVEKFRPGKKSFGLIKQLIQKEIKANPKLVVATEYIKDQYQSSK